MRVETHAALVAAVQLDTELKEVRHFDDAPSVQMLPSAAVVYLGDRSTELLDPVRGREYEFSIRIYARGHDLEEAQAEIMARADALDANLQTRHRLTSRAEVIEALNGRVGEDLVGPDPGLLPYAVTVVVRVRASAEATLSDATTTVTLHDVSRETLGSRETETEIMRDLESGALVAYREDAAAEEIEIRGRVAPQTEADQLVVWYEGGSSLSYSDQAGVVTAGWAIEGEPRPEIVRADDGESYQVSLRLWRV